MPRTVYEYERISIPMSNQKILREQGYTPFYSSNVSGGQRTGKDLYIRFHNGSVYVYPNQGKRFGDLALSPSKGKWVWANLRRPNVSYSKVGSMPLTGDRDVTDEELFEEASRVLIQITGITTLTPEVVEQMGMNLALTKQAGTIQDIADRIVKAGTQDLTSGFGDTQFTYKTQQIKTVQPALQVKAKTFDVFEPATTIEEATISSEVYTSVVDYGSTSLKQVNQINKTFDKLSNVAPLKEKLVKFSVNKTNRKNHAQYASNLRTGEGSITVQPATLSKGYYSKTNANFKTSQEHTISEVKRFNKYIRDTNREPDFLSTPANKEKRLERYTRLKKTAEDKLRYKRWSVASTDDMQDEQSIESVLRHEYGHAIEDQYIGKTFEIKLRKDYDDGVLAKDKYSIAYNKAKELEKAVNDNMVKARENGDIYNISEYGSSNDKEFFAETFAMHQNKEPLPSYIKKTIDDIIKFGGES